MERQIERWAEKIKKLELDIRNKDDNKEVALGTSKINYMDPRISVAWCKRVEVPIEKIFAKTLRDKVSQPVNGLLELVCCVGCGRLSLCLPLCWHVVLSSRLTPPPPPTTPLHAHQFVWAMGVPPSWRFEGKKKKKKESRE